MIPIRWTAPDTNGGCPITSYEILRDGGPNSPAYVVVHYDEVKDQPSLREFEVTDLPADILGQEVNFRIRVTNLGGYRNSSYEHLSVIIADVP